MSKIENAVNWAIRIAQDNSHGYDQANRWGPNYDCSSLLISAWEQAGVPVKSKGATYTGNMYSVFTSCGFKDVSSSVNISNGSGIQRGDVLLNHADHTAMSTGNGQIVQASINEFGGVTGGQSGDQTGAEIQVRSYYNYPWNCVLRYPEANTPKQVPGNAVNSEGIYYRSHCQTVGLLAPVHDGQTSGTTGYGKRLEALWVDPRTLRKKYGNNVKISAQAHIQTYGWRTYSNVEDTTMLGTTGEAKRLEAIKLSITGLPSGKTLWYRTHLSKTGWTGWVKNGAMSGTVGEAKSIEAIQIKII